MTNAQEFYNRQAAVVRNSTHPTVATAMAICKQKQAAAWDEFVAVRDAKYTGKGSRA